MKTSDLMQAMADAGAPMEAILIAVRAIEERDEAIEHRRKTERERKRRQRANVQDTDGTVTGQSRDKDGTVPDEAPLSLPPNENNSNPPTHTPGTQTPARKADPFPCPDWCEPAVWSDLKRNRRTKKLTNTETAHKRFVSEVMAMADEDWPPGRLVEAIAAKGWGGAHDPRDDRKPGNDRRNSQPAKQGTRTIAERVASRLSAAN